MTGKAKVAREQIILALRRAGATFKQLGELYDISPVRAYQIYIDAGGNYEQST